MARHTRQALKLRAELADQLKAVGTATGQDLTLTPEERAVIDQIMDAIDRKTVIESKLPQADDVADYVKLSAELRLLKGHLTRMLKSIRVEIPKAESRRTTRAREAANARWKVG